MSGPVTEYNLSDITPGPVVTGGPVLTAKPPEISAPAPSSPSPKMSGIGLG